MTMLTFMNQMPVKQHYRIHIGDYHASIRPTVISTLLGSCVAVCLYDPIERIGGMNHILIPGCPDIRYYDMSARYGINAMELLINRLMRLGGEKHRLTAKVFGGARTIDSISRKNSMGRKNVDFVLEFLKKESLKIAIQDVGGVQTRRLYFHTDTGDVFLKRGKPFQHSDISYMEKVLRNRISADIRKPGDVTLF